MRETATGGETAYRGYRVENAGPTELALLIYGTIDMGNDGVVDSARVVADLQAFQGNTIRMYINSRGGSLFGGLAIFNAMRRHPARKEVQIDGLCASAATIVAMGGDHVTAAPNAMVMVHAVWNTVSGNAAKMREEAQTLDVLTDTIVRMYVARTGRPRSLGESWVREETWFSASEALAAGLIDGISAPGRAVAAWDRDAIASETLPATSVAAAILAETVRHVAARAPAGDTIQQLRQEVASLREQVGRLTAAGGSADAAVLTAALDTQFDAWVERFRDAALAAIEQDEEIIDAAEAQHMDLPAAFKADFGTPAGATKAPPSPVATGLGDEVDGLLQRIARRPG